MVQTIYKFIMMCISFLPNMWIACIIGFLGLASADAILGLIDRSWRIIGR